MTKIPKYNQSINQSQCIREGSNHLKFKFFPKSLILYLANIDEKQLDVVTCKMTGKASEMDRKTLNFCM